LGRFLTTREKRREEKREREREREERREKREEKREAMSEDGKKGHGSRGGSGTSSSSGSGSGSKKNDPFVLLIVGLEESGKSSFANQLLRKCDAISNNNSSFPSPSVATASAGSSSVANGVKDVSTQVAPTPALEKKESDDDFWDEDELFDSRNSTRRVQIEEGVFRHSVKTLRSGGMKERMGVRLKVIDTPYILREKKQLLDSLKEIGTRYVSKRWSSKMMEHEEKLTRVSFCPPKVSRRLGLGHRRHLSRHS